MALLTIDNRCFGVGNGSGLGLVDNVALFIHCLSLLIPLLLLLPIACKFMENEKAMEVSTHWKDGYK